MHRLWLIVCCLLLALLAQLASAQEQIDPGQFARVSERIKASDFGKVDAVLVAVAGDVRFQAYYDKYRAHQVHPLQSVTKSINALLVGILIDQGYLKSVREPVRNFFPEYDFTDSLQARMTVEDLLTMTSGVDWREEDVVDRQTNDQLRMNDSRDYVEYFFSRPIKYKPGSKFYYNSGCSIVLGSIVQRASGKTVEAFTNQYLFKPLGITRYQWRSTKRGQYHTGGGLLLTASDLLKIGQMVLDGGVWRGKRIVSKAWIEESTKAHQETNRQNGWGTPFQYGYQWWTVQHQGKLNVVAARGWGDQRLFIIPQLQAVIVICARNFFDKPPTSVDHLLEALLQAFPAYAQ